ncbi:MAG TPA: FapA family protein [Rectinemataceae bacterium]|nr:FapA family protein [Rectinemataceae bacterium]
MDENEDAERIPEEAGRGQVPTTTDPADAPLPNLGFRSGGGRNDGSAEVSVSDDGMQASVSFFPPAGEGLPISREYLATLLARFGVTDGVLREEIDEALVRANLDRHVLRDVVVARGSAPVDETPEHAELEPKFRKSGPLVPDGRQSVDFRELGGVHVVKAGETLARIVPSSGGRAGADIHGKSLPYSRVAVEDIKPGANIERRDDALVSTVDGRLIVSGDRIDVDQVLVIKGEVDYSTGHVVFPGDVFIEGAIHDGFKVWSGGTIVCKSTMDAFDVNAKKDLVCTQGILGRRRAQIRVGGELKAKFVQNCSAAVRGDIHVTTAVVNCRLYSLGKVDLGDKGVLMGGEVYAVHGLRCGRLGNQARQRTMVHIGVDFTVQQRLDQANERLRLLAGRSRYIESLAASRAAARGNPELEHVRADIAKAAAEQSSLISRLLGQLDADDDAAVEVRYEVFPGAVIEICRISLKVEEHMKACRFRLDKTAGHIMVER